MKATCIKYLQEYVAAFQERRAKATLEVVSEFMASRPLEWTGNPNVPRADLVVPVTKKVDGEKPVEGEGGMTKSALKKQAKLQEIERKKAEKAAAKEAAAQAAAGAS